MRVLPAQWVTFVTYEHCKTLIRHGRLRSPFE